MRSLFTRAIAPAIRGLSEKMAISPKTSSFDNVAKVILLSPDCLMIWTKPDLIR